jgi:hypothetical protein
LKKLELSMIKQIGDVVENTESAMNKRLDDERARNQESLQKIEVGLTASTNEQSRAADERTKLSARLNVIEQKSNAILDSALEARLDELSTYSSDKLLAFESRIELMNASAEQRIENFAKDLQVVHATVGEQRTEEIHKVKLAISEVKVTIAQLQAEETSRGNFVDMDFIMKLQRGNLEALKTLELSILERVCDTDVVMKLFEEERTQSLEALKKMELSILERVCNMDVIMKISEEEHARNSEALKTLELSILERMCDEQARTQESLNRMQSGLNACTKEQARALKECANLNTRIDLIERKSNTNLDRDNAALSRIEAVETRLQAMSRTERELRNASVQNLALANRMEKVEAEQAKAPEIVTDIEKLHKKIREETSSIFSRIDAIEFSVSIANSDAAPTSTDKKARETKSTTDIVSEVSKARLIRSTKLPDEVLQSHSDLLQKIAQPLARTPFKDLGSLNAPYIASPPPATRSISPPRSPVTCLRSAEPSICIDMESQPTLQVNIFKSDPDAKASPSKTNKKRPSAPKKVHAW